MKDENGKLLSENKNLVMESETLKSCLARLEEKIEDLKEDIKQEVVEGVKMVVIETMKEENEKKREAQQSGHVWSPGPYFNPYLISDVTDGEIILELIGVIWGFS